MTGRTSWMLRLMFVAGSLSAAGTAQAQTVMVQVLGAETSEPLIGSTGILAGVVRDQLTERPIAEIQVRVRWSSFEATGASVGLVGREAYTVQETTTDANGFYRFCAVPRREELTIVSSLNGADSPERTLAIASREEGRMHVIRRER